MARLQKDRGRDNRLAAVGLTVGCSECLLDELVVPLRYAFKQTRCRRAPSQPLARASSPSFPTTTAA